MISTRATDNANRIEISDEASASPIHTADASHRLSIIAHPPRAAGRVRRRQGKGGGRSSANKKPPSFGQSNPYRLSFAVGVISLAGGFGGLHPHRANAYRLAWP